jgi:hypothetical protein
MNSLLRYKVYILVISDPATTTSSSLNYRTVVPLGIVPGELLKISLIELIRDCLLLKVYLHYNQVSWEARPSPPGSMGGSP